MHVRGPSMLEELLIQTFDWFQTLSNNSQQHATTCKNKQQGVPTDATCYIQQCWELLANNVAPVCTGFYTLSLDTVG